MRLAGLTLPASAVTLNFACAGDALANLASKLRRLGSEVRLCFEIDIGGHLAPAIPAIPKGWGGEMGGEIKGKFSERFGKGLGHAFGAFQVKCRCKLIKDDHGH